MKQNQLARADRDRHSFGDNNRYYALALLTLAFFASVPNSFFMKFDESHQSDAGGTSSAFYAVALAVYGLSLLAALARLNGNVVPLLKAWPIWLNVAFAFCSTMWSISPSQTLSRSIGLFGTTIAASFIATFPAQTQLRQMTVSFGLVIFLSISLAVFYPSMAITDHKGDTVIKGLYIHKNNAGWISAIVAIISYGALRANSVGKATAYAAIAASVLSTVLSRSATSILTVFVGFSAFWALGLLRKSGAYRPIVMLLMLGVLVALFTSATWIMPFLLDSFEKTGTLSGRTTLWAALEPAIKQRLFVGWGFGGALWESETGRLFFRYTFFAGNAQGGYTELIVNSGIIGCLLLLIPYIIATFYLVKQSNRGDRFAETLCAVLVSIAFLGVAAPVFMAVNQVFWIVIALSIFYQTGLSAAVNRTMRPHQQSPVLSQPIKSSEV